MGYPRSHLVDPATPGAYHCVSRCVRRAWLCGQDELTGQSFEHRRAWIESRIHLLAGKFALGLQAYAVMSNHLHLVVHLDPGLTNSWSDTEVIARWRQVFPIRGKTAKSSEINIDTAVESPQSAGSAEQIKIWRERLGSLSWFMRALLEPIARQANREDDCTGRFWEGRFFCQALLDERAILAASAYVDANPARAKIAYSLTESDYTGVAWRLQHPESLKSPMEDPPQIGDSTVAVTESPSEKRSGPRLRLVVGACRGAWLDISEQHYFELVSWTAQLPIRNATTEANAKEIAVTETLAAIGCNPGEWQEQLTAIRLGTRVAGGCAKVRAWAEKHGQRWIRRGRGRGATGRLITGAPDG